MAEPIYCPFCGTTHSLMPDCSGRYQQIICGACGARGPEVYRSLPYATAVESWNVRQGPSEVNETHRPYGVETSAPTEHLFEFWWAEYMPEATQERAWAAWIAAPRADGLKEPRAVCASPCMEGKRANDGSWTGPCSCYPADGVNSSDQGCAAHGLAHPCEACAAELPLIDALERINKRCPTDSPDYTIASVGDTARNALAAAGVPPSSNDQPKGGA